MTAGTGSPLEASVLDLPDGSHINLLRTAQDGREGKPRVLYSSGLCIPNSLARPLHEALARTRDVVAVDINGFDIGGTPPRSLRELVQVHRKVLERLDWEPGSYEAWGHSTGGTTAMLLCATDAAPVRFTAIQPILKNGHSPRGLHDKVRREVRLKYHLSALIPDETRRRFLRAKIAQQYANWTMLVKNGSAWPILDDITRLEYADRAIATPGTAYVSSVDNIFPDRAHAVDDLREGVPNARVVRLGNHAYCHAWPITSPGEAIRVLAHGGEPLERNLRGFAYVHPVLTGAVMAGAGALAYRALKRRR